MIRKKINPAKFGIANDLNKKLREVMLKPTEEMKKRIQQLFKPITNNFKHSQEIMESLHKISKHDAKKYAQPFLTNILLKGLIQSQTPKWINYTILFTAILSLIIGVWALIHSYI